LIANLSASPGLWQLTSRVLAAVFAGSAVTMSATVLHGGSLLVAEKKSGSVTQPPANLTVAPSQQLPQVSWPVPGQVPLWPSAAAPPWVPPFNNLPMFPPPMLDSPHYRMPVAPEPIADPSPMQIDPGPPAAGPTTPTGAGKAAKPGAAGPGKAIDPQPGAPVDGVVGRVFQGAEGLPR
jgi:hypothetical protein